MKKAISLILLFSFVCTMITSCSKFGSRQYVLDVIDAMDNGDDERFYKLLEDESYDINKNPNLLIERMILWCNLRDNPLEKACMLERYDYVEALINRGANLNAACNFGALIYTIFYMESESGKENAVAIAELLLKNGANPNGEKSQSYTALEEAVRMWKYKNSYQICKLLIEYGASENSIERAYKRAIVFEAPQEFLDLLNPDK